MRSMFIVMLGSLMLAGCGGNDRPVIVNTPPSNNPSTIVVPQSNRPAVVVPPSNAPTVVQ
jgi:hypothetical protein